MLYWLYRIQGEAVVSARTVEAADDDAAAGLADTTDLDNDDSVEVWSRTALLRAKRRPEQTAGV